MLWFVIVLPLASAHLTPGEDKNMDIDYHFSTVRNKTDACLTNTLYFSRIPDEDKCTAFTACCLALESERCGRRTHSCHTLVAQHHYTHTHKIMVEVFAKDWVWYSLEQKKALLAQGAEFKKYKTYKVKRSIPALVNSWKLECFFEDCAPQVVYRERPKIPKYPAEPQPLNPHSCPNAWHF